MRESRTVSSLGPRGVRTVISRGMRSNARGVQRRPSRRNPRPAWRRTVRRVVPVRRAARVSEIPCGGRGERVEGPLTGERVPNSNSYNHPPSTYPQRDRSGGRFHRWRNRPPHAGTVVVRRYPAMAREPGIYEELAAWARSQHYPRVTGSVVHLWVKRALLPRAGRRYTAFGVYQTTLGPGHGTNPQAMPLPIRGRHWPDGLAPWPALARRVRPPAGCHSGGGRDRLSATPPGTGAGHQAPGGKPRCRGRSRRLHCRLHGDAAALRI